jgi:hypothetical protein
MVSRRNREHRPARSIASREPRKRFLVVCEGKVTEPAYLHGLRRHFKGAIVELDIPSDHGVPLTLVQIAQRRKDEARGLARRTGDEFHAYDQVWCVFDIDEHPNVNDAKQLAGSQGIDLAISNPCFELWLVLHFRENPGMCHRHDAQAMTKTFIANYGKHVDFAQLVVGYDDAVTRAQRLDREATEQDEAGRNPTTGVYRLTQAIRFGC